jgi:hypothetical protein
MRRRLMLKDWDAESAGRGELPLIRVWSQIRVPAQRPDEQELIPTGVSPLN